MCSFAVGRLPITVLGRTLLVVFSTTTYSVLRSTNVVWLASHWRSCSMGDIILTMPGWSAPVDSENIE